MLVLPRVFIEVVIHGVQLATDDIFDALLYTLFRKVQGGVHIAVIGDRARIDVIFNEVVDQIVHLRRTVQKTVFRV